MIEKLDAEDLSGLDQFLGDVDVLRRRGEIPARVVVSHDDGVAVGKNRRFEDLAGMGDGLVQGAHMNNLEVSGHTFGTKTEESHRLPVALADELFEDADGCGVPVDRLQGEFRLLLLFHLDMDVGENEIRIHFHRLSPSPS